MSPRRIAVVTSSRADFSHLHWPLKALAADPALSPELIVIGAHLAPGFGLSGATVEADGFPVRARLECLLDSDTDTGMAKTIGVATLALADELSRDRPDLMLLIADRYEMLAPAAVALALRIPIVHIEGGEVSQGAIDEQVRNALTKMSHVHLTPHEEARRRVLALGEEPWRAFAVGAPSLDHLRHEPPIERGALTKTLGLSPARPLTVVAYHPVTIRPDTTLECEAVFAALEQLPGQIAWCFPNADAGSRAIIERASELCHARPDARLFVNLPPREYFGLLAAADLMLGNSSSGIMESPSFRLPTVNVGLRQRGRLCAANIVSCEATPAAILAAARRALEPGFRAALEDLSNPYGDGRTSERIVQVLRELPDAETLLMKQPVAPAPPG